MLPRQGNRGEKRLRRKTTELGKKIVLVNSAEEEYGRACGGDDKHESHGGEAGRD